MSRLRETKKFTSLIVLTFENLVLNIKSVSKLDQRGAVLQKLTENVHRYGKLLTLHFDISDLFSKVFKPLENSSRVEENRRMEYGKLWFAKSKNEAEVLDT